MLTETKMPRLGTISVRPAIEDDIPAIAYLLVQLYAAELPGTPLDNIAGQQSLLRYTIEVQPAQSLQNRYVLVDSNDHVLATGMIQLPNLPAFDRAPQGTIRMASKLLGLRGTWRLFKTVARSRFGAYSQHPSDAALLHSVVVDAQHRGMGLGHTLMDSLEQTIAEQGYPWAVLQVLANNEPARRLYLKRGYQEIWRSPRWVKLLSWPSSVLRKELS